MTSSDFDPRSGSLVERALFNHRWIVVLLCALVTVALGWQATRLQLNASFEKTIAAQHSYVRNFLAHQHELSGLGNAVRIAVANPTGTIYDATYLETLRQFSDEVFVVPGVARNQMKSLWTPTTRWVGVTEEGLEGGPVIPDGYDGSAASLEKLRANIARSGEIGQIVALDAKSSVISPTRTRYWWFQGWDIQLPQDFVAKWQPAVAIGYAEDKTILDHVQRTVSSDAAGCDYPEILAQADQAAIQARRKLQALLDAESEKSRT